MVRRAPLRIAAGTARATLARGLLSVVVAAGTIGLASPSVAAPPAAASERRDVDRFDTVVIDAGHGGDDHGAAGPGGLLEKDLVLDVAKRLSVRLRERGLRVVMTREHDHYVSLQSRTAAANASGGDLFLSVHANAAPSRKARGIETYFASLEATDEAASSLASRENAAFREAPAAPDAGADALGAILGDLIDSEHFRDSDEFARLAHGELSAIDPVPARGVKQAPFTVLMGVEMPATLVEIGFITNPAEEQALGSTDRQEEIASALERAVHEFARRHDARRGLGAGGAGGGR